MNRHLSESLVKFVCTLSNLNYIKYTNLILQLYRRLNGLATLGYDQWLQCDPMRPYLFLPRPNVPNVAYTVLNIVLSRLNVSNLSHIGPCLCVVTNKKKSTM